MNIECPHCNEVNTLEFAENIHCHKCQSSFKGFSFKKHKKSIIGTGTALLLGAYGGIKADSYFLEPKRYSTSAIYEIVSYCANPTGNKLTKSRQEELAKSCICALDKTMKEIGEGELAVKSKEFIRTFNKHNKTCR